MTVAPLVYVSRRLGRAAEIGRLLEQGGCEIRPGPVAPDPKVATRFAADEIVRYFRDVDEAALRRALDDGRIAGAGLDV